MPCCDCRYSVWDYSRLDIAAAGSKKRKLQVPMGEVALHLRGGTIVPMQQQPALVARDVRLSPITLVVALPSAQSASGSLPAYSLDESCAAVRAFNPGKLVSCGYLFMDSGEDVTVTSDNSVQVRTMRTALRTHITCCAAHLASSTVSAGSVHCNTLCC